MMLRLKKILKRHPFYSFVVLFELLFLACLLYLTFGREQRVVALSAGDFNLSILSDQYPDLQLISSEEGTGVVESGEQADGTSESTLLIMKSDRFSLSSGAYEMSVQYEASSGGGGR